MYFITFWFFFFIIDAVACILLTLEVENMFGLGFLIPNYFLHSKKRSGKDQQIFFATFSSVSGSTDLDYDGDIWLQAPRHSFNTKVLFLLNIYTLLTFTLASCMVLWTLVVWIIDSVHRELYLTHLFL